MGTWPSWPSWEATQQAGGSACCIAILKTRRASLVSSCSATFLVSFLPSPCIPITLHCSPLDPIRVSVPRPQQLGTQKLYIDHRKLGLCLNFAQRPPWGTRYLPVSKWETQQDTGRGRPQGRHGVWQRLLYCYHIQSRLFTTSDIHQCTMSFAETQIFHYESEMSATKTSGQQS